MKGVMIPVVSAGSNHVGASVTCTAQVSWPSGAAGAGEGASDPRSSSATTRARRVMEASSASRTIQGAKPRDDERKPEARLIMRGCEALSMPPPRRGRSPREHEDDRPERGADRRHQRPADAPRETVERGAGGDGGERRVLEHIRIRSIRLGDVAMVARGCGRDRAATRSLAYNARLIAGGCSASGGASRGAGRSEERRVGKGGRQGGG